MPDSHDGKAKEDEKICRNEEDAQSKGHQTVSVISSACSPSYIRNDLFLAEQKPEAAATCVTFTRTVKTDILSLVQILIALFCLSRRPEKKVQKDSEKAVRHV